MKNTKQLERHFKGIANYRRIDILLLISKWSGLSVDDISESLNCNFKTASEHTRRLVTAGLVQKEYRGRRVIHSLTLYGKQIIRFVRTFQHS